MCCQKAGHVSHGRFTVSVQCGSVEAYLGIYPIFDEDFQIVIHQLPIWCVHLHLFQQPAITPSGVKAAVSQGVFFIQDRLLGARSCRWTFTSPLVFFYPSGVSACIARLKGSSPGHSITCSELVRIISRITYRFSMKHSSERFLGNPAKRILQFSLARLWWRAIAYHFPNL